MRNSTRNIALLAVALAFPLGAGCAGDPIIGDPGFGGDGSAGEFPEQAVAVAVTSGGSFGSGSFLQPGVWFKRYGDEEDQRASAQAVNYDGEVALVGTAKGTINFGNIPWDGTKTDTDVVVAKLSVQGQSMWSRRYGDSCDQHGGAVAHLPSGSVLLAGDFCGTMDFGTTTVQTKGAEVDLFVAVIDTLGEDVYSKSFGGKGAQVARAAVVDPLGNAVIVGSFAEAFDDGGGETASAGLDDAFVLKLDPQGKLLWSLTFGGPESDLPRSVALDPKGNIVIGGSFGGSVDFGGGPLTAPVGHQSGFVLELDPGGKHLWSKTLGGDAESTVNAVAVSPKGTIAAAGSYAGTADFGGGPVTTVGLDDAFVAVMDGAGKPSWGRMIRGGENQRGTGVSFAPNEDVAFSGTSDEAFDLGQQFLALPVTRPYTGLVPSMVFAVKFSEAGVGVAGLVLEGDGAMESVGIGFDQSFGMALSGSYQKTLGVPAGPIDSAGGWDVFVVREL